MKNARVTASPERRIQLIGQIDDDSTRNLFEQLNVLEAENNQNIEIELHSEGGFAYNALAIVGRMRQSKCKILVTGYAQVASAAVVILAAGNYRRLSKESFVQVHEDAGEMEGSVSEMEKNIKQFRNDEARWNKTMNELTGNSVWEELHKRDTYLTPEQCLELNLVDEII